MRVLLCDDHRMVNQGLCRLLGLSGWEVRGVLTADDTLKAAEEWAPDIVLLDVNLEDRNISGFEVMDELRARYPDLPVIIFSMHEPYTMQQSAVAAGARGFMSKDDDSQEMVAAVECVVAGGTWFPERAPPLPAGLTQHRLMVLHGICDGKGLKQIAADVKISLSGVKYHRTELLRVTGTDSTRGLVHEVTKRGWLLLPTVPRRGTSCTSFPIRRDRARSAPPRARRDKGTRRVHNKRTPQN